jgi:hypothetical protein
MEIEHVGEDRHGGCSLELQHADAQVGAQTEAERLRGGGATDAKPK